MTEIQATPEGSDSSESQNPRQPSTGTSPHVRISAEMHDWQSWRPSADTPLPEDCYAVAWARGCNDIAITGTHSKLTLYGISDSTVS